MPNARDGSEFPKNLVEVIRESKRVPILTGTGISQEIGLRTFRDVKTGLWTQYKSSDLATPRLPVGIPN
ncbi:MAG: Sir2 family NAD-dependent protein deacetylase [Nitrospiria bacterium]